MMKFAYQYSNDTALIEVTMSPETTLTEALEEFEHFLVAAGYCFEGHLEINNEEDAHE